MGFQSKALARLALAVIVGSAVCWACLAALIALSVGSPVAGIARGLLAGWLLAAAGWLTVRASYEDSGITWRDIVITAGAWPVHVTLAILLESDRPWK